MIACSLFRMRGPTVALALLCAAAAAAAQTVISGSLSTDTHLTAGAGPYIVPEPLVVTGGAVLTIDPGVEMRFADRAFLSVEQGKLVARGTEAAPVLMTRDGEQKWDGLIFQTGAVSATFNLRGEYLDGCILEHCIVEQTDSERAIYTWYGASPFLSATTVRDNDGSGLLTTYAPGIRIQDCYFHDNGTVHYADAGGINVRGENAVITGNLFERNYSRWDTGGVKLFRCFDVLFEDNELLSNHGGEGGGLNVETCGGGQFLNNVFRGNDAAEGGAISLESSGSCTFAGNLITGNQAIIGGGIYFDGMLYPKFSGDRIIGNTATERGGGVAVDASTAAGTLSLDPDNPTFLYGNSAPAGSQLYSACTASTLPADAFNATNIWWNTTDPGVIDAGIVHLGTDPVRPPVIWDPYYEPEPNFPGDANGDWYVNIFDAFQLNAAWGRPAGEPGYDWFVDFNQDNVISIFDAFILNQYWGTDWGAQPAGHAVPEPATGLLMLTAACALPAVRRRRPRRPAGEGRP